MKYESCSRAPKNVPIWGCAYKTTYDEKGMSLKKEPVLGMIKEDGFFYELKKNGDIKKSNRVLYHSRQYADTLEECVEIYNEAVEKQINLLQTLINNCEKDKLIIIKD